MMKFLACAYVPRTQVNSLPTHYLLKIDGKQDGGYAAFGAGADDRAGTTYSSNIASGRLGTRGQSTGKTEIGDRLENLYHE